MIAFAGSISADAAICNEKRDRCIFPIVRGVTTLEEANEKENAIKKYGACSGTGFQSNRVMSKAAKRIANIRLISSYNR